VRALDVTTTVGDPISGVTLQVRNTALASVTLAHRSYLGFAVIQRSSTPIVVELTEVTGPTAASVSRLRERGPAEAKPIGHPFLGFLGLVLFLDFFTSPFL
jgi:hypothetical protein